MIEEYKQFRKQYPDSWIRFCEKQHELKKVIEYASKAIDKEKRKHPHQISINDYILNDFCKKILKKSKELTKTDEFNDIYNIIESCRVKRIGDLTIYDTALRIGSY